MPYIYADPLECTGCRICELICSFTFEKVLNPKKARVRVRRLEPAIDIPIVCRNCEKPPCVDACPTGAMYKSPKTDIVLVDEKKCIGCAACVDACPFGAVFLHPDKGVAVKCTVCGACVEYCPVGCLKKVQPSRTAVEKQYTYAGKVRRSVVANLKVPEELKSE